MKPVITPDMLQAGIAAARNAEGNVLADVVRNTYMAMQRIAQVNVCYHKPGDEVPMSWYLNERTNNIRKVEFNCECASYLVVHEGKLLRECILGEYPVEYALLITRHSFDKSCNLHFDTPVRWTFPPGKQYASNDLARMTVLQSVVGSMIE